MYPLHNDCFLKVTAEQAAFLHFDTKPAQLNLVPHRLCILMYQS